MKKVICLLASFLWGFMVMGYGQIPRLISYQGVLTDPNGNVVADGTYTLTFRIYDVEVGGRYLWMEAQDVAVSNGLFSVQLGRVTPLTLAFDKPYWLGMSVNWGVELSPRTPLAAVPYSFNARSVADSSITSNKLADGAITKRKLAAIGGSSGQVLATDGTQLVWMTPGGGGGDSWNLLGNAGTDTSRHFLGTTDNTGLIFKVNKLATLRLLPAGNELEPSVNIISGFQSSVKPGVKGATISGGGYRRFFPLPATSFVNRVTDDFGTIGGGADNQTGDGDDSTTDTPFATVGGGVGNQAVEKGATIGGGLDNQAKGMVATIGGGMENVAEYKCSVVAGGCENEAIALFSSICGGFRNRTEGEGSTVCGGEFNVAKGNDAAILGGNSNTAEGAYAMILGGRKNQADGEYSLAAGYRAAALKKGCFVWGDATDAGVSCNVENRWLARASGGVYFYTNGALSTGSYLAAGGSSWNTLSGRKYKENFAPVDSKILLRRLAEIEISSYNYKDQSAAIRHIGPMAEDFNRLVEGLGGEGVDHINTMDAIGVAMAAIQGLYQMVEEQQAYIKALEERLSASNK